MRYRLRTLLILLAIVPPLLAGTVWIVNETMWGVVDCKMTAEQWEEMYREYSEDDNAP